MAQQKMMRLFAKWHIWLGWLVGVPILMWTVTGLVMVINPIEEVRGTHLRKPVLEEPLLPAGNPAPIAFPTDDIPRYREMRVEMQDGRPVWLLTDADGNLERVPADMTGEPLPVIDEAYIRDAAARLIVGGENPVAVEQFSAEESPFDFRRPIPSWRVTLEDGAHIYFDARTGQIAAVRTRFWRVFDFMWGLHIMDLQTRDLTEQSTFNHTMLVLFAGLSVLGSLIGCTLMFRRRKARVKVPK
ncbi:PepSY domain-containing protein [Aurantiacibacter sp. MUD61]|uniref:PepSY domain-containing protein n=1 Tax=Aurantiacibacter sp. MUD61 TaxID=3009083 RepID=UPI0022F0871A|nr:PepSY domain-containing protein [Aurantiacibacter sp. MUD61]